MQWRAVRLMEAGILLLFVLTHNLLTCISLANTWLHCLHEVRGDLAGYFDELDSGRTLSLHLPKPVVVLAFGPGLAAVLSLLALIGYDDGGREPLQGTLASVCLAALCGARVGDALLSHWLLAIVKWPNPGLWSTIGYVIEAAMLVIFVNWGTAELVCAALGLLSFWAINPLIGLVSIRVRRTT